MNPLYSFASHVFGVARSWRQLSDVGITTSINARRAEELTTALRKIWGVEGLRIARFRGDEAWKGWGCRIELFSNLSERVELEIYDIETPNVSATLTCSIDGEELGSFDFFAPRGTLAKFYERSRENEFAHFFNEWKGRFLQGCFRMGLPVENISIKGTFHEQLEWRLWLRETLEEIRAEAKPPLP